MAYGVRAYRHCARGAKYQMVSVTAALAAISCVWRDRCIHRLYLSDNGGGGSGVTAADSQSSGSVIWQRARQRQSDRRVA